MKLGGHVNYYLCDTVIPTTIVVVETPSHGTLAVRDEIVNSGNPELGTGGKCRGKNGIDRVIYDTRTTAGVDTFRYDASSENGVVHVAVSVQ